ncbi:MAG: T9SS type A sorting domain-containing protein [Bacteroidota bacterium]|jgi:predicted dienelactone hydrolase
MIRKLLLCGLAGLASITSIGQNYPVGHITMNFTDTARNNRALPAEVYYPALSAGDNVPVAAGAFPVISFGHGFLMAYSAYAYLKDSLVPRAYIIVMVKTEGGISPSHSEFGKDLAFIITRMKTEGNTAASPFYQHIDSTSAIMGHSMGGGASFLACQNNSLPTAMITLAAAETSPSAIQAATQVTTPSLVFSADKDCVTPPAQNQVPMYDSLASSCKVFINIKGGGHCYFADYNFTCSLGETGCQQNFTISREQQHSATLDFLYPFLDYYLKKNSSAWTVFNDSLTASQRITYMEDCSTSSTGDLKFNKEYRVFPNPADEFVCIKSLGSVQAPLSVRLFDVNCRELAFSMIDSKDKANLRLDISGINPGFYLLEINTGKQFIHLPLLKGL